MQCAGIEAIEGRSFLNDRGHVDLNILETDINE